MKLKPKYNPENGLWGFENEKGEIVIPCQYYSVTNFKHGVSEVEDDSDVKKYIGENGKELTYTQEKIYFSLLLRDAQKMSAEEIKKDLEIKEKIAEDQYWLDYELKHMN